MSKLIELGDVAQDARPVLADRHAAVSAVAVGLVIQLGMYLAERRRPARGQGELFTGELTGFDDKLFMRQVIENADVCPGIANAVAQLFRQVSLQLISRDDVARRGEQRADDHPRPAGGELSPNGAN